MSQVDADLSSIEAELAALELQKQEAAEAATTAAAAAESAAAEPPPRPPPPRGASPPASAHSSDVEVCADGLATGLSQLAAQDGGFPRDSNAAASAKGPAAGQDATPMRKRLLLRHRADSGSLLSPSAAAAAGGADDADGADEAEGMEMDRAVPSAGAAMAAARIAEAAAAAEAQAEAAAEAAFVEEILAAPDVTEVRVHAACQRYVKQGCRFAQPIAQSTVAFRCSATILSKQHRCKACTTGQALATPASAW